MALTWFFFPGGIGSSALFAIFVTKDIIAWMVRI
jgi:hypothetical protein